MQDREAREGLLCKLNVQCIQSQRLDWIECEQALRGMRQCFQPASYDRKQLGTMNDQGFSIEYLMLSRAPIMQI